MERIRVLEKGLVLKMKAEPGKVYGEKDLLISLFANLIDNSKKASDAGEPIMEVSGVFNSWANAEVKSSWRFACPSKDNIRSESLSAISLKSLAKVPISSWLFTNAFKLLELLVMKKQDFEFVNLDAHYFIQTVFDLGSYFILAFH